MAEWNGKDGILLLPGTLVKAIVKHPELRSCGPLSLTTILIEINEMIDFRIDLQINVQI